jgi:hypothetical protein
MNIKPELVRQMLKTIKSSSKTINTWQSIFNETCLAKKITQNDYYNQNIIANKILTFYLNNKDTFYIKLKFEKNYDYFYNIIAIRQIQGKSGFNISNELNIKYWLVRDILRFRKLTRSTLPLLRKQYIFHVYKSGNKNKDAIAYKILIDYEKKTNSKKYKSFMIKDILDNSI